MSYGFIKLARDRAVEDLLMQNPNAFLLLTLIAYRARRSSDCNRFSGLNIGEALIGDYRSCGLTEQTYRSAKKWLESNGLATFKPTNKGTIATICSTSIYDINADQDNGQNENNLTVQQRTDNGQATTNKNDKKEENEKKTSLANEIVDHYNLVCGAMPRCIKLTSKRQAQILARIDEVGVDTLKELISGCSTSNHLQGKNDRGWTADLEWITKAENFIKIQEGKYKNKVKSNSNGLRL